MLSADNIVPVIRTDDRRRVRRGPHRRDQRAVGRADHRGPDRLERPYRHRQGRSRRRRHGVAAVEEPHRSLANRCSSRVGGVARPRPPLDGPADLRWTRAEEPSAQGELFGDGGWQAGSGEYRGLEFLHVRARADHQRGQGRRHQPALPLHDQRLPGLLAMRAPTAHRRTRRCCWRRGGSCASPTCASATSWSAPSGSGGTAATSPRRSSTTGRRSGRPGGSRWRTAPS